MNFQASSVAASHGSRRARPFSAPASLLGIAAVSPIIEIEECTRSLERKENIVYEWNFMRDLKRRIRRKNRLQPGQYDLSRLDAVKTVRQFDDTYTAPYFGFRSAEDYYYRASALRVIERIKVPTLIITAEDDPFVPAPPFRDAGLAGNPHIDLRLCAHGGHCGFIGARSGMDDGYWAEGQILDFVSGISDFRLQISDCRTELQMTGISRLMTATTTDD